ncbi:hypothetical protein GCM10023198_58230 [Promicromonospora umidemergens]|uniref:Uncharacterized protein n=1 Tax=Promicromonospora umidemergens TaxID=629679 RepID=A0ABP8YC93_9MICO
MPFVGAAAAVAVWLVGAALGVELEARTGASTQSVSVVAMLVAALVSGLVGWGVRTVIGRLAKGGGEVAWLVLCGVVLLGSLVGAASGTTPGAVTVLMVAHVVVGLVVALGLRHGSGTASRTS